MTTISKILEKTTLKDEFKRRKLSLENYNGSKIIFNKYTKTYCEDGFSSTKSNTINEVKMKSLIVDDFISKVI